MVNLQELAMPTELKPGCAKATSFFYDFLLTFL